MIKTGTFETSQFDVSKETENEINPIYGESLLLWIKEKAKSSNHEVSSPDFEDWGWYSHVEWNSRSYMLGASSAEDSTWFFHITKRRGLMEKVMGKEKFGTEDECWQYFISLLQSEPNIKKIETV